MFGFPVSEKPESLRFANNSLQTATFQIKYQVIDIEAYKDRIIECVKKVLPQAKGLLQQTLTLATNNNSKTPIFSSEGTPSGLEFRSQDNAIAFIVRNDSMTLEMLGEVYTHFADARDYLERTFYPVSEILGISCFNRVAIRKINVIGSRPTEGAERRFDQIVRSVFNDDLIGPALLLPPSPYLFSTVTNCRFMRDYNNLNLIYGLLPSESEQDIRQILLDIDIFSTRENVTVGEAKNTMTDINDEIFNVFMWALKPEIKSLLQQTA